MIFKKSIVSFFPFFLCVYSFQPTLSYNQLCSNYCPKVPNEKIHIDGSKRFKRPFFLNSVCPINIQYLPKQQCQLQSVVIMKSINFFLNQFNINMFVHICLDKHLREHKSTHKRHPNTMFTQLFFIFEQIFKKKKHAYL